MITLTLIALISIIAIIAAIIILSVGGGIAVVLGSDIIVAVLLIWICIVLIKHLKQKKESK